MNSVNILLLNCKNIRWAVPVNYAATTHVSCPRVRGWVAAKGKSTVGWFFGFELHIVINDCEEIIQWTPTQGNTDDREPLKNKNFTQRMFGKLFADKGYIRQDLFAPSLFC